jgi:hypothetical protein
MHLRITALLALLTAFPIAAMAGEASGEFTAGTRVPIHPKYAAAFETRDQRDAHKVAIEVVLSEAPVDIAAAVAELDPHSQVINQPALMKGNYILLWVRPGNDVSMNATYSDGMVQFADMTGSIGSLTAELTTNTLDNVAGHVFTKKPVKTSKESYSVNLQFSTAVTRLPKGTKLPADGGPAGKALQSLLSAIAKKNLDGIKASVTPENVKHLTDEDRSAEENLANAIETLGFWLPKKSVKIIGGEQRDDAAVLDVEGEIFEGQKALYQVRMVKRDSHWLFDRATKAGLID